MVSRGAQILPADVETISQYLAEHYGVDFVAPPEQRLLVWVDHQGKVEPLAAPPRNYNRPRLSPDGRQVAADVFLDEWDIWIYDIPTGELRRLTYEGNNRFSPPGVSTASGWRLVLTAISPLREDDPTVTIMKPIGNGPMGVGKLNV